MNAPKENTANTSKASSTSSRVSIESSSVAWRRTRRNPQVTSPSKSPVRMLSKNGTV